MASHLSGHEHEVVEHQRGRLQRAPAAPSQTWGQTLSLTARFFLWCAGAGGRGEEPRVHQLDVTEPGQQVGQHDLPAVGVSGWETLAHLCTGERDRQRSQSVMYKIHCLCLLSSIYLRREAA